VHERWANVDVSWTAVTLAFVGAIAALFLRRLLPEAGRDRGRLPILFLALSVLVRLAAVPFEMMTSGGVVLGLNLAAAISLALGLTGIVGTIAFDLILLRLRVRVPSILRGILLLVAFAIALLTILHENGANLLGLVTTSAVLTAVIGLALQEPLGNMFAGLSLQMDGTLGIGDWIRFDDREGRIIRVSFRATTLVTTDGDSVTIPNRQFMQRQVSNYSRPTPRHRVWTDVTVHYRHAPNEVRAVLADAVRGCAGVRTEPPVEVVVRTFGDHGVTYTLLYWIDAYERQIQIDSEVRARVWYACQRAGLEIPYPTRTLLMHQVTAETRRAGDERDYMERLGALSKIDLFSTLDEADVDLLARGMTKQLFARGETLVRQGEPGDSLYLIAAGEVGVVLAVEGKEREVATLRAGEILGERSLITGEPRTATCVAHSDVVTHVIAHDLFQRLLEQKPALAETISRVLSERQVALDTQRDGLSAEAQSSRRDETQRHLLEKIRAFFHLG
jgi:small-conductance mechanosensitive channel/CRP-like cAMP-binding protein